MSERLQRGLGWASVVLAAEALLCRVLPTFVLMLRNSAHRGGWQFAVTVILWELFVWGLVLLSGVLLVRRRPAGPWVSLGAGALLFLYGFRWAPVAWPVVKATLAGTAREGAGRLVESLFFLVLPLVTAVVYPWLLAAGLVVPALLAAQRALAPANAPAETEPS